MSCHGETDDGEPCELSADWGESRHPDYCEYHEDQAPYETDFSEYLPQE